MKLSNAAELAMRGILTLAARRGQGPTTLDEICRTRRLPRQYLTKIFGMLVRARLLTAVRGKGGGYELGKPPDQITLLAIIEAVEGPLAVNLCQHDPARCEELNCPVRPVWSQVQQKVWAILGSTTLAQLLSPQP
jgi:Rrf2 family protein